ncbi:hypothetical protein [Planctomycetes bacterium TBK1r]|uniref:Phage Terminase n=1 Tax=Stieleria magnilauensis TaxID=2527963 RepID=A0ABX5XYP8_9BACT|nr:Phage Terminase [Planctomycetes bacterium TBK1r]
MIDVTLYRRFSQDPAAYRESLVVDVDGRPKRFGEVMDDWQRRDFEALDPSVLRCLNRWKGDAPPMRAYFERARGASKTTDIAVMACYLLAFAPRVLRTYAFACDRDQAGLLRDACERLIRLNPWLGKILEVKKGVGVVNVAVDHPGFGSTLSIETSDVGSSYGLLADAIFFDEITHWTESAEALWASILSTVAKRASCVLVGISNAGFVDTWQHRLYEAISADPAWIFSRKDGPASWIADSALEEQRRLLPNSAYRRLWWNEWSAGEVEPALCPTDVAAAFSRRLVPLFGSEPCWGYVAGLDLGVSRDHSGLVVLAVRRNEYRDDTDQIRLAYARRWRPPKGMKVDLMEVEEDLRECVDRFGCSVAVDPWQAELLGQRLSFDGVNVESIAPTAKALREMATKLREIFTDRRIKLSDVDGLRSDIERLTLVETAYGFRLRSPRDKRGHGDLASALCLALVASDEITAADPAFRVVTL